MKELSTIIQEVVNMPVGEDCPYCGAKGTLYTPLNADYAICKECGKTTEGDDTINNNKNTNTNMKSTTPDGTSINTKSDIFERLVPMQLNALMETLVRNKKQFNALYSALASEGFVPLNEAADYNEKRSILGEMLKDGKFTKHMLETLVEMNHLQIGKMGEAANPEEEENSKQDVTNPELQDTDQASLADFMKPGKVDPDEPVEPTKIAEPEPDITAGVDFSKLGQAKEIYHKATEDMQVNMRSMREIADVFDFTSVNDMIEYIRKNDGHYPPKPNFSSEDQQQYADEFKTILQKQKQLTLDKQRTEKVVKPPVYVDEPSQQQLEPVEMDEVKRMQLKKGTGASELQLRAGSQGKIFESRVKKLEPYKKIALLEFLENDPQMLDDQDYLDMAVLTGINEGDIVALRMEYETMTDEAINEVTSYPVFGGQDVRGENKKNENKSVKRDMGGVAKSQETVEDKVFKIKKYNLADVKDQMEKNGLTDQNRGMHTQIDVLNQESNQATKDKYQDQANGVFGKRDPNEVKNDVGVGDGKAGENGVTNVGDELLKKGADQPDYYATTPNETEKPVQDRTRPIAKKDAISQPIKVKNVNEDLDRMKNLFEYDAHSYANSKPKITPDKTFNEQLTNMRMLSESVDISDRPTKKQLAEMKIVEFKGQQVRSDGVSLFNESTGENIGECGAMEEGSNEVGALRQQVAALEQKRATMGTSSPASAALDKQISDLRVKLRNAELLAHGVPVDEARNNQLKASKDAIPAQNQLKAGTKKALQEYDISGLDEGSSTGKKCKNCGHIIYKTKKGLGCMCDHPEPESDDPLVKEMERQNKLAGVKTLDENKRNQLRHTKGNQLRTGTKEELVEEKEVVDNGKQHPTDAWLDKKKAEKEDNLPFSPEQLAAKKTPKDEPIDEAKNLQLKHTKGNQLKAGTKVEDKKEA
jgi:hypothetical protein